MCVTSTFATPPLTPPKHMRDHTTCSYTDFVIISFYRLQRCRRIGVRSEHSASPYARPAAHISWAKRTRPPSHAHLWPRPTHPGNACASKDATAWAALGCDVADPTGTCVGTGCAGAGLVPLGATAFVWAAGYYACMPFCPADGGDFVNLAGL